MSSVVVRVATYNADICVSLKNNCMIPEHAQNNILGQNGENVPDGIQIILVSLR